MRPVNPVARFQVFHEDSRRSHLPALPRAVLNAVDNFAEHNVQELVRAVQRWEEALRDTKEVLLLLV
jgi:hypothetical protein